MNRKLLPGLLIAAGILFQACKKDTNIFVPDPGQFNGPDTAWYSIITPSMPVTAIINNLSFNNYTDSIQVNNNNAYLLTPFGLNCGFPPHSIQGNAGQVITGTVQVEVLLVKKKGDMIRLNLPTTSNSRLLVSGGEVFIRLKKENQELQLAPNARIYLNYPADQPLNTQMKLFLGVESNSYPLNWYPNSDPVNNTLNITPQNYEIQTNHLHWISTEYFYDTTNMPRVTLTADLANYFTNANTIAFTVFRDFRSVVGMYGNISTRSFSTGRLPGGKAISIVVISKQGNDYFLGYENTVTTYATGGTAVQHVAVKPVIKSLPDILNFLNSL